MGKNLLQMPNGGLSIGQGQERLYWTKKDIEKRYRRIAFYIHPDKCNDSRAEQGFKRLGEAYEEVLNEHGGGGSGSGSAPNGGGAGKGSKRKAPKAAGEKAPKATGNTHDDAIGSDGGESDGSSVGTPPSQLSMQVELEDGDPDAGWEEYDLSITMTWKKKPKCKDLTESQRRTHARHVVGVAHRYSEEWTNCRLYSDSVERGTEGGCNHAHHVQGFRTVKSRGGIETAIKACEVYYRACDYLELHVQVRLVVKEKGFDQSRGDLFCYTFKQWSRSHFFNHHGGPDYDEETHAAWWAAYEEAHSSVSGSGFGKHFTHTDDGDRTHVNNTNFVPLAIMFTRRCVEQRWVA